MLARLAGEPQLMQQLVDASGLRVVETEDTSPEYLELRGGNNK